MGLRAKRLSFIGCLTAATCVLGVLAPTAFAWEYVHGPPKVETALVHPVLASGSGQGTHALGLSISSGFCAGEPPPKFDHMKLVERPKGSALRLKSPSTT